MGAFGVGAVLSATLMPMVRKFLTTEQLIALSAVVFAALEITVGLSSNFWLVAVLMFLGGGSWVTTLSSFQTAAQSTLPSWVRARALSVYVLVLFGGLAGGSVFWGNIATHLGTEKALLLASMGMLASLSVMLAYRLPEEEIDSEPSWFGFPISLKEKCKISREELIKKLYDKKIGTRLLFSGNLTKQPAYKNKNFKISGNLSNTDYVMKNTFWVGVFPGLGEEELSFISESINNCFNN